MMVVNHLVVTTLGVKTTGTVIISQPCDDEDVCLRGFYSYRDWLSWEHKFKFHISVHQPDEHWIKILQNYKLGAQNTVYYLPFMPFIHEMQFGDSPLRHL